MALVTITEAAKLTGKARKTLYAHINKGKLSCGTGADGQRMVDTSELIRVYGEIKQGNTEVTAVTTPKVTQGNSVEVTPELAQLIADKVAQGIEQAQKPLLKTIDKLTSQVENLTNRLEHKPEPEPEPTPEPKPRYSDDPKPKSYDDNISFLGRK